MDRFHLEIQKTPVWIYLPAVYGLIPLIHFLLLKTTLSNESTTAAAVSLMFLFPLMFPCEDALIHQAGAFASMILFVLRALEVGTFDRECNRSWTMIDYAEFLASSDNTPLRSLRDVHSLKLELLRKELNLAPETKPKWKPHIAMPKDRGLLFYLQFWTRLGVTFLCYAFALAYFEKYEYEPRYGFLSPFDVKGVKDHLMVAVLVYGVLELSNSCTTIVVSILLQTPYVTIFNHPYLATSLREFWSHRWNYMIKETLHHLSFKPTLTLLYKLNPPRKSSASSSNTSSSSASVFMRKSPSHHLAIASMAAFLMSALLHEYLIFFFIPQQPLGENTIYFLIQGILCFLQFRLQQNHGGAFSGWWLKGRVPGIVNWAFTLLLLCITCPLFIGPYARSGLLMDKFVLPVPRVLVEVIKEWI
ncbi:hypothetical protein BDR26DRAFT_859454 [Obelidium mucronatum]|nr:hypothetical protein BDR26DRAFT_859454 [Obelidium mucronatum]